MKVRLLITKGKGAGSGRNYQDLRRSRKEAARLVGEVYALFPCSSKGSGAGDD